ncbi:MAG TPA: type II secretion system protein [Myxococcota bacterium]|nr:type II secretion system protein [Myxococcota bacterium]
MRKTTNQSGFTLLEVMTAVAVMGFLLAMAVPNMLRMRDAQETKSSGTQMAGLLSDARARAVSEGTPHLVYFNAPTTDGAGNCGAVAVEVRDLDHSYSITPGDQTQEFNLPSGACNKVKPYDTSTASSGSSGASAPAPVVPMPAEDLAVRAPDAASVGAVASASSSGLGSVVAGTVAAVGDTTGAIVGGLTGSGSGSSGSGSSGSDDTSDDSSSDDSGSSQGSSKSTAVAVGLAASNSVLIRSATVAETAVNGATFPVDAASGRTVVAFSEHGVPVDPSNPTAWGSGAGGIYLTDTEGDTIVAALVQPLGDVKLRVFDPASQTWK